VRNIAWSRRNAVFGALLVSIPTVVIVTGHVHGGLALLFGALPAALIGVLPTRRKRRALVVIGAPVRTVDDGGLVRCPVVVARRPCDVRVRARRGSPPGDRSACSR
jgi:hypothetical protein